MARGKQAAEAARRRAESAHEVIDRLTSDLADAKIRARMTEAEAARVPGLLQQVVDLSARLDAACSTEVESLRQRLAEAHDENDEIRAYFKLLLERSEGQDVKLFAEDELLWLNEKRLGDGLGGNRATRRVRRTKRTAIVERVTVQDNGRSFHENLHRAAGRVGRDLG